MTSTPTSHEGSSPRRPRRDPGDAWVVLPSGERFWGKYGAAGLVAHDAARGVLLQHRADWSHHGGTWGIPGGAINEGELSVAAALRESAEEAAVPAASIHVRGTRVLDLDVWSYTTVIGDVVAPFEPVMGDTESVALRWVPVDEVSSLALHPGFARSWPVIKALLETPPLVIVVDAANVVGSVPDGWWADRQGATARFISRIEQLAKRGVPGDAVGLDVTSWRVHVEVVVEGTARGVDDGSRGATLDLTPHTAAPPVQVVNAPGLGDDTIVERVGTHIASGAQVWVVTSDRGLRERVLTIGAQTQRTVEVRGARWLLDLMPPTQVAEGS